MFTGIVEEVGTMQGVRMGSQSGEIHLQASLSLIHISEPTRRS